MLQMMQKVFVQEVVAYSYSLIDLFLRISQWQELSRYVVYKKNHIFNSINNFLPKVSKEIPK